MNEFRYQAIGNNGASVEGVIAAEDRKSNFWVNADFPLHASNSIPAPNRRQNQIQKVPQIRPRQLRFPSAIVSNAKISRR
jgi:hypothetical protein